MANRKVHIDAEGRRYTTSSGCRYVLFDAERRIVRRSDNLSRLRGEARSTDTIVDFDAVDGTRIVEASAPRTVSRTRKCQDCQSSWPALATVEAFRNYKRIEDTHPGRRCQDADGWFGPSF